MDCITLVAEDGADLDVLVWEPAGAPRGIVQIVPGMCEYAARYDGFAEALVEHGWFVIAAEHRGQGPRAAAEGRLGQLPDRGYHQLLDDMSTAYDHLRAELPGVPWVLVGHSMGSFLARTMAARRGREMAALVLLGTGGSLGPAGGAGAAVADVETVLLGEDHPSALMNRLAFGPFNAAFMPARTEFDWLSRDTRAVDDYVADPLCGYVCSTGFYRELLRVMRVANSVEVMRAIPPRLPVGIFSGAADPVGGAGRGVRQVARRMRANGVRSVDLVLYPGARHEILHEVNRRQVESEIIAWIDSAVQSAVQGARATDAGAGAS